jgi:NHS family xanthosine MFS transporter
MSFFQFFVWGAWLITIGNYWFDTRHWETTQFGLVFGTMGVASLFLPAIMGIVADRWVSAQKLYGILHLLYAIVLFCLPQIDRPTDFIYLMLLAMCFYMPTIALSNSISYSVLKQNGREIINDYPQIRVFGTIGFIAAMWMTNLSDNKATASQFYIAGVAALFLGTYAFTLPDCKPPHRLRTKAGWTETLGPRLSACSAIIKWRCSSFFRCCSAAHYS